MDFREAGWSVIDWIDLAEDRYHCKALVNTIMHLRFPQNARIFLGRHPCGGFSRMIQLQGVICFVRKKTRASETG
jgi:hypothetical protein